jgi:hypothetical protein
MAKEVSRASGPTGPVESMRAADSDRHQIAEQIKAALDEGRLSLHEYDDRVSQAYAARTYAELLVLVADLPKPGMSAAEVNARQVAQRKREDRRMPTALVVLWTIWASLLVVNLVVYGLLEATTSTDDYIYPWPIWLLVPGAALGAVTIGVQKVRRDRRK